MSSMSSAKPKSQRADSMNKGGTVSALGVVGRGPKAPVGKSSPSSMLQRSKIPTNAVPIVRPGGSHASTEDMINDEILAQIVPITEDPKPPSQNVNQEETSRTRVTPATSARRSTSKSLGTSIPSPSNNPHPTSKSKSLSSSSTSHNPAQKRLLESQFTTKKRKYLLLKKDLSDKQKNCLDLYEDIIELRDKVIASGLKDPGKPEEITVLQVSHGKPNRLESALCEGSGEQAPCTVTSSITNEFVGNLEGKLQEIPNACLELCREALNKRSEILTWLTDFGHDNNETNLDPEIAKQLEVYQKEGSMLQTRLEETSKAQEELINDLIQKTSALWGEHENYRLHIRELENAGEGLVSDMREKLNNALAELNAEHEKANQLKERRSTTEGQLQKAKSKIRELEAHASNDDTKIQQLQANIKALETAIKQKDATHELRTKDMQKTVKNSEGLVAKMEKQRDSLESRLIELKKKIGCKESESETTVKEIMLKLDEATNQLNEERDVRQQAEAELSEIRERCSKLEEKSQQLCDLAEKTKDYSVTDGNHTENEVRLWNELQEVRTTLSEREDKLVQLQHEKEEIVAVMHQAADQDIKGSVKEKLAAELIAKTEDFQSLTIEHTQLEKNYKAAQEKCDNIEKQLSDLHNRLHAQCKEGGKAGWGAHTVELQQQVSDLHASLADLARHNEELETALTQKQLELEQRDRVMREQSKVLKVRDELIDLLKGKDQHMNGDIGSLQNVLDENNRDVEQVQLDPETLSRLVNKQIAAKAEELQELYSTLESKQMQVMRLEKMVKQMEDQQDRAQAQRTRLENRIAQLELALEEKNRDHRSRGFFM